MDQSTSRNENVKRLKTKIWAIKGILWHNLNKEDLDLVIEKLKRIDMVPSGYLYPELNRRQEASEELK